MDCMHDPAAEALQLLPKCAGGQSWSLMAEGPGQISAGHWWTESHLKWFCDILGTYLSIKDLRVGVHEVKLKSLASQSNYPYFVTYKTVNCYG